MLYEAPIILFKVTGICAVTILSIVHPSLDVLITRILILTNLLIKPLLIKEKLSNQGGIEVYARSGESATNNGDYDTGKWILEVIYCLMYDAIHDFSYVNQPYSREDYGALRSQDMTM